MEWLRKIIDPIRSKRLRGQQLSLPFASDSETLLRKRKSIFLYSALLVLGSGMVLLFVLCCFRYSGKGLQVMIQDKDGFFYAAEILEQDEENILVRRLSDKSVNEKKANQTRVIGKKEKISALSIASMKPWIHKVDPQPITDPIEPSSRQGDKKALPPQKYLGYYTIHVKGHSGQIYFGIYQEKLIGTIRFPQWAKGKLELLKNVQFNGSNFSFVRSVSNSQEMKRVGAPHFFRQEYSGRIYDEGRSISGMMISDGEKSIWTGKR